MSRASNGTYTAPTNSWNTAVEGTVIDESDWAETLSDMVDALTDSVSRTGKGTVSAHIDFDENGSPGTPASNVGRLYAADVGGATSLMFKDAAGNTYNLLLASPGLAFSFDTSTDTASDPGNGDVRFNSSTYSSVTEIAIDDVDGIGNNVETFMQAMDENTYLFFSKRTGAGIAVYQLVSASNESGFTKLTVTYVDHDGSFAAGDPLSLTVGPAGPEGAPGPTASGYARTRAGTTQDLFDMADTWNAGGTSFTAIKMNVTDTSSASTSKLLDLQVGGSSRFAIGKGGTVSGAGYSLTSSSGDPMVNLAATWNLSSGGSVGPALLRVQLTDTQSPPLSKLLDLQVGGGSAMYVRKDGAVIMQDPSSSTTYVGMKRSGGSLIMFSGPGAAYDEPLLTFKWQGTAGEVSTIQSEASNRLSIESAAAIVHIAENGRYEWESDSTATLDFIGYESSSAIGKPFNFNNSGQTPTIADVAYFSTHDRSYKPLAIRFETTTLAYFDGYGKLVLPYMATTGQSLTGSQATSLLDLATTWNTTGAPSAIKLNVTNTASDAAALLVNLQVGGTTLFKIDKAANTYAKGIYGFGGSAGSFNGIFLQSSSVQIYTDSGTLVNSFHTNGLHTASTAYMGFSSSGDPTGSLDTLFARDAAGIVSVRGSSTTSPGALSFYTYGASPPSAPSASMVRLYADTSGGKIRLMAVFPSGSAQQIAIEP